MLSSSGIILASETLAEMETEMEDHEKKNVLCTVTMVVPGPIRSVSQQNPG